MLSRKSLLTAFTIGIFPATLFAQEPVSQDQDKGKDQDKPQPDNDSFELHRLRIVNRRLGTIQVSTDAGSSWSIVGRVTQPCTGASEGYIAAEYAPVGSVAAVAVHGLRIRISGEDPQLHAPLVMGISPTEFSGDKANFGYGGHRAGSVGMQTDIPAGTSIFRELAPLPGNMVYTESRGGRLIPLPEGFKPRGQGEILIIPVRVPLKRLREVLIENKLGGKVSVALAGGESRVVTYVVKPVAGIGRFDGTSYTGVGRINTAHTGVITVSTAPIDTRQPEGEGKERRGGFQISPFWHNGRTNEHDAPMMLLLGALGEDGKPVKRRRELEGTAPLFLGHLGLFGEGATVDWQIDDGEWEAMPPILGVRLDAFTAEGLSELWKAAGKSRTCSKGVTGFRIRLPEPSVEELRKVVEATQDRYRQVRLAEARINKVAIVSGQVTINSTMTDPTRVSFLRLSVDGNIKALKNFAPFVITWDTTHLVDGEYFIEIEALDSSGAVLASTPRRVFVLNRKIVPVTAGG
ncbi:hypothetical protein [Armatimonas sp.]|uniref:hypothetical protein n=1 Tax=Armatimonas sp. TaxID=1872638 RepID=UPI00286A6660|nr:hypothetical protein [Armatimonas sp.]